MEELLKTYVETAKTIFKSFGIKGGYGEIDISTDSYFRINSNDVWFQEEEFGADDEATYCNEIRRKYENETHYALYVDNGCGDSFYQIFDKKKEVK